MIGVVAPADDVHPQGRPRESRPQDGVHHVLRMMRWGALIDLGVFLFSLFLPGGAEGMGMPMFVLHVLNFPLHAVVSALVPSAPEPVEIALSFAVVILNGALYGLVAALFLKPSAGHPRQRTW